MTSVDPVLESVSPVLQVKDLSEALDYYRNVLGFQLAWTWGEPPNRASVCRDRVELTLAVAHEGPPASSTLYFSTTGVGSYYEQVCTAGATVTVPIGDRPYGMRDFSLTDPSGNELCFGEPTAA